MPANFGLCGYRCLCLGLGRHICCQDVREGALVGVQVWLWGCWWLGTGCVCMFLVLSVAQRAFLLLEVSSWHNETVRPHSKGSYPEIQTQNPICTRLLRVQENWSVCFECFFPTPTFKNPCFKNNNFSSQENRFCT